MKTVHAPNTAAGYVDAAHAWAQANPGETYFLLVAALMVACWWLRDAF